MCIFIRGVNRLEELDPQCCSVFTHHRAQEMIQWLVGRLSQGSPVWNQGTKALSTHGIPSEVEQGFAPSLPLEPWHSNPIFCPLVEVVECW